MFTSFLNKFVHKILTWDKGHIVLKKNSSGFKSGRNCRFLFHDQTQYSFGRDFDFRDFVNIRVGKGATLKIGDRFFMNNFCSVNCLHSIEIGKNVLFGEGVKVYDHNHEYATVEGNLQVERNKFSVGEVKIGDNCWLGTNVVVLKGVTIGENTIIGAGCVIYKDVPANSIVVKQQNLTLKESQ